MSKTKKTRFQEITANIESKKVDNRTKEETIMTQKEERLPTDPIDQDAAYVSVKAGGTINLGNFNNGRVDVSLMYPCYPSEVEDVYKKVKNWTDEKVSEEIAELRKLAEK